MKRSRFALMLIMGAFLLISPVHAQPAGSGYHIIDSLRLGGEGGWDYLSASPPPDNRARERDALRYRPMIFTKEALMFQSLFASPRNSVGPLPLDRRGFLPYVVEEDSLCRLFGARIRHGTWEGMDVWIWSDHVA